MRSDYIMGTLNPDDPALPIYEEYINHARPLDEWVAQTPPDLASMLTATEVPGWTHWYFNMDDNIALSDEKKARIIQNVPEGTKLWKNKILGLRGRATGLVFSNFRNKNIVSAREVQEQLRVGALKFKRLAMGIDTSYSTQSPDTIALEFVGITNDSRLILLEELVFNNAELREPLAPSDVVRKISAFADYCRTVWGDFRYIFIDSADQATLTEAAKYKRNKGSIYMFSPAYKDMKVMDRINHQLGWIAKEQFLVCDHCSEYLRELGVYAWQEDKDAPEDKNDHTINACQYAWLPFVKDIGIEKGKA